MKYSKGELVLLPFPFSDQTGKKVRPAVIVSNNKFNNASEDVIMLPLTSVIKEVNYSILIDNKDLSSGELIKPSRIRLDKIFTINKKLIMHKIGLINQISFSKIKKGILEIL